MAELPDQDHRAIVFDRYHGRSPRVANRLEVNRDPVRQLDGIDVEGDDFSGVDISCHGWNLLMAYGLQHNEDAGCRCHSVLAICHALYALGPLIKWWLHHYGWYGLPPNVDLNLRSWFGVTRGHIAYTNSFL